MRTRETDLRDLDTRNRVSFPKNMTKECHLCHKAINLSLDPNWDWISLNEDVEIYEAIADFNIVCKDSECWDIYKTTTILNQ